MATIDTIKDNILKMEAGEFQNLCDSFLMKEGYQNSIVSYGSQPGTKKTVKGTPDTYFRNGNGKYVLAEYTTVRKKLFVKIKSDIEKCLKEDLPDSEIEEIIYFHTSSRLTAGQDRQLHNLCETHGISLCLIGIDTLAELLYLSYPRLVRDFLGLIIDTEQIQSVKDFVKQYNAPVLAAPLDIPFLFREEELKAISTAFQSRNVVVLKGPAGNGKTRLALHFAEDYAEKHEMKLYCIRDKGLPLFDDLRIYLTSPGKYFVVVDDANELTGLKHVLQYATDAMPNVTVKILVTVRDYAYEKISRDIASMVEAETVEVGVMTDEQLTTLLKKEFGIHNPLYQKRILQIARGNARLAVLAGKLACTSNNLQSIEDATQLYDCYYQNILNTLRDEDNRDLFVCSGIIAFLDRMRIDQLDSYQSLLTLANVSDEVFVAATRKLHSLEVVNIFQDKAVVFADQCLKNYLIKYVFCDRKFISLQKVIEICFSTFQNQTIQMVSMLLSIFNNETLEKQVTEAVKLVWKKLEWENSPLFDDFVQSFYAIDPIEALCLQKRKIDSMDCVALPADQIDTETDRDNRTCIDPILRVLGGLFCLEQGNIAMDLFFEYYRKRPDLYMRFYQTFKCALNINTTTIALAYGPQKLFLQKLRTYSNGWRYPAFMVLFWEVAKELLEFSYSPVEPDGVRRITICYISLGLDEGVKQYRHLIWKSMLEICAIDGQEKHALKLFRHYGSSVNQHSIPVLIDDQEFIIPVLDLLQPRKAMQVGLAAERLIGIYDSHQIESTAFEKYLQVETMQIYRIVTKPDPYIRHKHPEREQQYVEELAEYARSLTIQKVEQLHELAIALAADDDRQYRFFSGLSLLFENLASNAELYRQAVACYLHSNTPGHIWADTLIELLFKTMSAEDVWMLINRYGYDEKIEWQNAYYRVIPDAWITQEILDGLLAFYRSDLAVKVHRGCFREIIFLQKYMEVDPDVFVHVGEALLHHDSVDAACIHRYFGCLFDKDKPQKLIHYFHSNIRILEDIYIRVSSFDNSSIDFQGTYLKEFCRLDHEFLNHYLTQVFEQPSSITCTSMNKCVFLFELDNYLEIFDEIFEYLFELWRRHHCIESSLQYIIVPDEDAKWLGEKQELWIRHLIIKYCRENEKMNMLFQALADFENNRKVSYYLLFLKHNESFDDFKELPLTPLSYGGSGSLIPIYIHWKEFVSSLDSCLTEARWLEHKRYLQECKDQYQKMIEDEELRELLSK